MGGNDNLARRCTGPDQARKNRLFQSFQLIHTLTVFENVELPLLLAARGTHGRSRGRLSWVELDELGARYPHQLSAADAARSDCAGVGAKPAILLADEADRQPGYIDRKFNP